MSDALKGAMRALLASMVPQIVSAIETEAFKLIDAHAQPQATAQAFSGFGGTTPAQPAATAPAAVANPFGGAPAQPAATSSVTPEMIQTLITPLVQNEQVKAALSAAMQAMGIQNLPDAKPEQLAPLYAKFQEIEGQARAAGLLGGAPAAAPALI